MRARYRLLLFGLLVAGTAVSARRAEAVYGALRISCSVPTADLKKAVTWHRVASRSAAFASCVDTAMRFGRTSSDPRRGYEIGPYHRCQRTSDGVPSSGYRDPFYLDTLTAQIARALDAARSPNDLLVDCAPTCSSNADCASNGQHCLASGYCSQGTSSGQQPETFYAQTGPEEFRIQLGPLLGSTSAGANAIAHEAMHQHGYLHGYTDGDGTVNDAPGSCGYTPGTATVRAYSGVPYIVGECIQLVLDQSKACAGFETACPDGLMIVSAMDQGGASCSCVTEPHDPFTVEGYVCMTARSSRLADPSAGTAGTVYVSINDAPSCGGSQIEDGYLYSTGATYSGSHWSAGTVFSEAALGSLYRSLQSAGKKATRVRLTGTNERPHAQVHSVTILGR